MTNVLIGVGGTGAKIVESALILAAAGLGPSSLVVGLVDQDNSNGNVARTRTLLNNYRRARSLWGNPAARNYVQFAGQRPRTDDLPFLKTDVSLLFGERSLWCPGGDQTTLRGTVGVNLSDVQKDLFDLLFMPGEEEQDLQLGEGYRGRAHVGAAALISRLSDPSNPLTTSLEPLMEGSGGREQVNIFLAGSAFGGTGAAGFPTIARELHRIRTSSEFANKGQVAIGGALMLPYFGFSPPDADDKHLVVTTDELLPKAQMALEYYDNLFQDEQTFDRFYLVGWERFFNLGYHEAGNAEQKNPPLLPELFAATAAMSFFSQGESLLSPDGASDRVKISARRERAVSWEDLPLEGMRHQLGQLLRFCVYWRYVIRNLVEEKRPWIGKGNWTQSLTDKADREDAIAAIESLDILVSDILTYAAAVERTAGADWALEPWRMQEINGQLNDAPTEPVALVPTHPDGEGLLTRVVRNSDGSAPLRDAAAVYSDLETNSGAGTDAHHGYGRVIAAAYNAARLEDGKVSDAA